MAASALSEFQGMVSTNPGVGRAVKERRDTLHLYVPYSKGYEIRLTLRNVSNESPFQGAPGLEEDLRNLIGSVQRAVLERFNVDQAVTSWGAYYNTKTRSSRVIISPDAAKVFDQCKGDYSKISALNEEDGESIFLKSKDQTMLSKSVQPNLKTVTEALSSTYDHIAPLSSAFIGPLSAWKTTEKPPTPVSPVSKGLEQPLSPLSSPQKSIPSSPLGKKGNENVDLEGLFKAFNEGSKQSNIPDLHYDYLVQDEYAGITKKVNAPNLQAAILAKNVLNRLIKEPEAKSDQVNQMREWLLQIARFAANRNQSFAHNTILYWLIHSLDLGETLDRNPLINNLLKKLSNI